jgi:hypothetical protein
LFSRLCRLSLSLRGDMKKQVRDTGVGDQILQRE